MRNSQASHSPRANIGKPQGQHRCTRGIEGLYSNDSNYSDMGKPENKYTQVDE